MPDLLTRASQHRRVTALRRGLRRHRRIIVALLAAAAAFAFVQVAAPPPPATTSVVVAARDVSAGTVLGTDDVELVRLPRDVVPAGSSTTVSAVLDEILAAPVRAGEPLTDRRLVGDALISGYPAGIVATPVRIGDVDVVDLLEVGDRIDVYAALRDGGDSARHVVGDAVVVTLPQSPDDDRHDGALVVLAVPPAAAAALAQASAEGPLSIALRG